MIKLVNLSLDCVPLAIYSRLYVCVCVCVCGLFASASKYPPYKLTTEVLFFLCVCVCLIGVKKRNNQPKIHNRRDATSFCFTVVFSLFISFLWAHAVIKFHFMQPKRKKKNTHFYLQQQNLTNKFSNWNCVFPAFNDSTKLNWGNSRIQKKNQTFFNIHIFMTFAGKILALTQTFRGFFFGHFLQYISDNPW